VFSQLRSLLASLEEEGAGVVMVLADNAYMRSSFLRSCHCIFAPHSLAELRRIMVRNATTRLKVLALHGYGQNAHIFRTQIGSVCRACADEIDFVFLDAPVVIYPIDEPCTALSPLDENGFPLSRRAPVIFDPQSTPRGWFTFNESRTEHYGLDGAFWFLRSVLERERFDGIIGFSQGALMASYLCTYLQDPCAHRLFQPRFHPLGRASELGSMSSPSFTPGVG